MTEPARPLILQIVYHLPLALVLTASVIGCSRYRRLTPSLQALVLLAGFDALSEVVGTVLFLRRIPNVFLSPLVLIGEMGLWLLLYSRALQLAWLRQAAPWIWGVLVVYVLLDNRLLAPNSLDYLPSLRVISDLLPLLLALLYFRQLLNELLVERLSRDPLFWLSAGLVLYTLGDLFIALFSNFLFSHFSHELNRTIWLIHNALNSVLYTCYCVALLLRPAGRPAA